MSCSRGRSGPPAVSSPSPATAPLGRLPSQAGWARARKIADDALAGHVHKGVGYATHYHTYWVVPYWSANLTKLANVGSHIFYRWEGGWGRPPAFVQRASGIEPQVALIRHLSSAPVEAAEGVLAAESQTMAAGEAAVTADMRGRGVVRRYEPIRAESVSAARAELARSDVPQSLRWALTGEATPVSGPLSGVRRKTSEDGAEPPRHDPLPASASAAAGGAASVASAKN